MPIDRGFRTLARPPVRPPFRAPAPPPKLAPKVRANVASKPATNGIGDVFARLAATAGAWGIPVPKPAQGAAYRANALVNPPNYNASPYFTPQILPKINFAANPQLNVPQGWNYGRTWGLPPVQYGPDTTGRTW